MTTNEVLLLIAAILAMVSMAAGMTYWSRRNYDELRRVVAASDEAMQKAAGPLGLEFVPQGSYQHPIVGSIPTFGFVRGVLDGIRVHARVDHDADGIVSHLRELAGQARQTP